MKSPLSPGLSPRTCWVSLVVAVVATGTSGTRPAIAQTIPGIPHLPNLVTVVPFQVRGNIAERTKVLIPADIGERHGMFILDIGDPYVDANRDYVRPGATGGLDTVAAGEPVPPDGEEVVPVTMRIGTLQLPHPVGVHLDHIFNGFRALAPRLGNIGIAAMDPFETIIDYRHQRVILIRLDAAGHRLAKVPAYTPVAQLPFTGQWGFQGRMGDVEETLVLDNGTTVDILPESILQQIVGHLTPAGEDTSLNVSFTDTIVAPHVVLDHLVIAGHRFDNVPFDVGGNTLYLGYPFLRQLGVIGFNFRTRQLILYH